VGSVGRRPSLELECLEDFPSALSLATYVAPSPKPATGAGRAKPMRVSGVAIMVDTIQHEGLGSDEAVVVARQVLHTDDELASTRAQEALALARKQGGRALHL